MKNLSLRSKNAFLKMISCILMLMVLTLFLSIGPLGCGGSGNPDKEWNLGESFKKEISDERKTLLAGYYDESQYEQALKDVDKWLKRDKKNDALLNEKAMLLNVLFQYDEALAASEKGLALNPENVYLLVNKAKALQAQQSVEEARDTYEKALMYDPEYEDALIGRAECLMDEGIYQEAAVVLEKLTGKIPDDTYLKELLVDCYKLQNKYEKALEIYNELLDMEQEDPHLHYLKADVLLSMGKYVEAVSSADKAIKLFDGVYVDAYYVKSCAYASLKNTEKCLDALSVAAKYGAGLGIKELALTDGYFERLKNNSKFKEIINSIEDTENENTED